MLVSEEMITAAYDALCDQGFTEPYGASVDNYVTTDSAGEERRQQLQALNAADEKADRQNREAVRAVLIEAMAVHVREREEQKAAAPITRRTFLLRLLRGSARPRYWWALAALNALFLADDMINHHTGTAVLSAIVLVLCVHFALKTRRR